MTTVVRGRSDDLVDFEGDLYGEFYCSGNTALMLMLSDTTVLRISYGHKKGIWKIVVDHRGELFDRLDTCEEDDGSENYSDVVHFRDGLKWVRGYVPQGVIVAKGNRVEEADPAAD